VGFCCGINEGGGGECDRGDGGGEGGGWMASARWCEQVVTGFGGRRGAGGRRQWRRGGNGGRRRRMTPRFGGFNLRVRLIYVTRVKRLVVPTRAARIERSHSFKPSRPA
jgi:hypothetical protein